MDLSKLPSKDPAGHPSTPQPAPPPVAADPAFDRSAQAALPKDLWLSGPEAFLCAAVALFFVYQSQNLFHHADVTATSATGVQTTISYWRSWYFISDGPLFLLAVALTFEVVAMAVVRQRWAGWACVGLMGLAAVANIGSSVYLMTQIGLQLIPAVAACVACYGCWATVEKLR